MDTPAAHPLQYKLCTDCWANLPVSAYGRYKAAVDGLYMRCRQCVQEYGSFRYTRKVGRSKGDFNPEVIRNVRTNNRKVILEGLKVKKLDAVAFNPHNGLVYKVQFGSSQYALPSLTFYSVDGSIFRSMEYSGSEQTICEEVVEMLCVMKLRLELSEVNMIASKNVIYCY